MSTTIFTGGLAYNITESHLKSYFSRFGIVSKAEIARHKTGLSKGYGFVFFADESGVSNALKIEHHEIIGRKIDVQKAKERPQKEAYKELVKKCRVFVGGLTMDITDFDLKKTFQRFGIVKSAYIIKDYHEQKSLGFGYVLFKDAKVSQKLIDMKTVEINGALVNLSPYKFKDKNREKFGQKKQTRKNLEEYEKKRKEETYQEAEQQRHEGVQHTAENLINSGGPSSLRSISRIVSKKKKKIRMVIAALPEGIHGERNHKVNPNGCFDPSLLGLFSKDGEDNKKFGVGNLRFNRVGNFNLPEENIQRESLKGWDLFGFHDIHH